MSGTNPLPAGQAVYCPPLASGNLAGGGMSGGFNGQGASNSSRPLWQVPQNQVRQPYLGGAPTVGPVTGFGSGGGGGIANNGSDADISQGIVRITVGLNPLNSGNVGLNFTSPPTAGSYSFAGEWFSGLSQNIIGNALILGWAASRPLVTGEILTLAYRWTNSN